MRHYTESRGITPGDGCFENSAPMKSLPQFSVGNYRLDLYVLAGLSKPKREQSQTQQAHVSLDYGT